MDKYLVLYQDEMNYSTWLDYCKVLGVSPDTFAIKIAVKLIDIEEEE